MKRAVCVAAVLAVLMFVAAAPGFCAGEVSVLIVDGQNNHDWAAATPVLKRLLEESGVFSVDVATTPPQGASMAGFAPSFGDYSVVLLNYNGDDWPEATRTAFERYVRGGGGVVVYHAANNAFPAWTAFNRIIGLGGWGGRDERSGPYIRFRDGVFVHDDTPGVGGSHGKAHPFVVTARNTTHPIMRGLPASWMHATDELYDRLRGPAENLTVLATAFSDTTTGGTGEHEPILMTVSYGKGRVFHTALGHDASSMACVGFIVTLLRGTEWAATGAVERTAAIPSDFPAADRVRVRKW